MKLLIWVFLLFSGGVVFSQSPNSPVITYLSFDSLSQQVDIHWNNSSLESVGYIIYFKESTGLWIPLDTVLGINNTFYKTQSSNAFFESETYSVVAFDALGNNSPRSEEHSTLFLQSFYDNCDSTCYIIWNRYENMFLGEGYFLSVYSGLTDDNLTLTDQVFLSFSDTSYYYPVDYSLKYSFVISVYNINNVFANSNSTKITTISLVRPDYCYINKVSVNNDNNMLINALTNSPDVNYLNFYRSSYEDGFMQEIGQSEVIGLEGSFVDTLVNPEKNIYYYSVKVVDFCGREYFLPKYQDFPDTAKVNNLFLQLLSVDENNVSVSWNDYSGFLEMSEYELWIDLNDSIFPVLKNTIDSFVTIDLTDYVGSVCLFLYSIESIANVLGKKDTVISNKLCFNNEPIITIPNSFTPDNGDGKNDIWKVYYYDQNSIYSVSISVYNLWGERVFFSNDINFIWDGTVNQSKAPSGTYIYFFTASYGSREFLERKGVLTILR